MKVSSASLYLGLACCCCCSLKQASGFQAATTTLFGRGQPQIASFVRAPHPLVAAAAAAGGDDDDGIISNEEEEEEEPKKVNPYNDENYPELEFIDYSDPNYVVDQGVGDEFFDAATDDTEEQIEAMREDRRRRNDEFQFETYFEKILKNGDEYCGEWTIYKTSTFLEDESSMVPSSDGGAPRILQAGKPIKVKSRAYKISVDSDSEFRVDGERICHEEIMVVDADAPKSKEAAAVEAEIMGNKYWPNELKAYDFRGWQGIMCVGAGHTMSAGVPLVGELTQDEENGPYSELRAEVGISDEDLRMRVKFDYSVLEAEKEAYQADPSQSLPPALHLKSMTVCREARGRWPENGQGPDMVSEDDLRESEKLFGIPGASGGLYDPPPVGDDVQSSQYMMLDLEGGSTVFFPYMMNQDTKIFDGYGWVTSLDWTPGKQRYQVDRKVKGNNVLGLRTLELSEVQSADAEMWRPRDGGEDMRQ